MRTRILILLCAVFTALLVPDSARSIGMDGCAEGECIECHSLDREEARKLLTGLVEKVNGVEPAIVPGMWKVDVESQGKKGAIYVDFSKKYTITGQVIRLNDWADVSAGSVKGPEPVNPAEIPLEDAVLLGRGEAANKVIVFTDPQCPFCKKMHAEFKKVIERDPDTAFYMKLYPLKSHPDSYRISKSIVCEKSLELLERAFAGGPIPDPTCETDAVDETRALVKQIGVRSTPTLVLPDGTVLPGFKPADKLLQVLSPGPD